MKGCPNAQIPSDRRSMLQFAGPATAATPLEKRVINLDALHVIVLSVLNAHYCCSCPRRRTLPAIPTAPVSDCLSERERRQQAITLHLANRAWPVALKWMPRGSVLDDGYTPRAWDAPGVAPSDVSLRELLTVGRTVAVGRRACIRHETLSPVTAIPLHVGSTHSPCPTPTSVP